jgi:hypothetical protein
MTHPTLGLLRQGCSCSAPNGNPQEALQNPNRDPGGSWHPATSFWALLHWRSAGNTHRERPVVPPLTFLGLGSNGSFQKKG